MLSIPEYVVEPYRTKLETVLDILVQHAMKFGIQSIWLFGSLARNDYTYNSDIDLLIITSGNTRRVLHNIEDLDIDDISFPSVDFVVKTVDGLMSDTYVFNTFVQRDRILLWESNEEVC